MNQRARGILHHCVDVRGRRAYPGRSSRREPRPRFRTSRRSPAPLRRRRWATDVPSAWLQNWTGRAGSGHVYATHVAAGGTVVVAVVQLALLRQNSRKLVRAVIASSSPMITHVAGLPTHFVASKYTTAPPPAIAANIRAVAAEHSREGPAAAEPHGEDAGRVDAERRLELRDQRIDVRELCAWQPFGEPHPRRHATAMLLRVLG